MHAETEAVGLTCPVIRILTDDHDLHILERSELERVEDIRTRRIDFTGPVFFEDHKYTPSRTFFDAQEEPRVIHPNKEVEQMFNCVHLSTGEYLINSNIDFLNQPGHFALEFAYKNIEGKHIRHKVEFDVLSPKLAYHYSSISAHYDVNDNSEVVFQYSLQDIS